MKRVFISLAAFLAIGILLGFSGPMIFRHEWRTLRPLAYVAVGTVVAVGTFVGVYRQRTRKS